MSPISTATDFFLMGGNSLLAGKVVSRLRSTFQTELPFTAMFDHRTIADMAAFIQRLHSHAAATPSSHSQAQTRSPTGTASPQQQQPPRCARLASPCPSLARPQACRAAPALPCSCYAQQPQPGADGLAHCSHVAAATAGPPDVHSLLLCVLAQTAA